MINLLSYLQKWQKQIILFLFVLIFIGFYLPNAILSTSTILLFAVALFNKNFLLYYKSYFSKPQFWAFYALFFLYLIGGFYTQNTGELLVKMKGKLALGAFSFGCMPLLFYKKIFTEKIYFIFIIILFFAGIYTLADFVVNYEIRTQNTQIARYTFSPTNHIVFSLLIANAIFILGFFLFKKYKNINTFYKFTFVFLILFFIFLLHFNAARTGILAFYFTIFVLSLKAILVNKKHKIGIAFLAIILLSPIVAYKTIPSFKNKITYTIWDLQQVNNTKEIKNYSDAKRIVGYKIAWQAFKQNPIFGCGTGNFKDTFKKTAYQKYSINDVGPLYLSNQFFYILATLGIVGFLAFVFLLIKIFPLNLLLQNNLLLMCFCVNFISLLPESILEIQLGIANFCIFTNLANCYFYQKN